MKRASNQHVPFVYYRLPTLSIACPRDEYAVVSAVYLRPDYASEGSTGQGIFLPLLPLLQLLVQSA